jgi:putative hydrolase of the HAD superfamily
MARAVLVDLGGVLLHTDWDAVAAESERALGLSPQELLAGVYGSSDQTVLVGRVPEEAWWEEVRARLGVGRERIEAIFMRHERCDDEFAGFLASLRGSIRLGVVSNAWPSLCERARERWRLASLFETMVFSCEVAIAKPDERIYRIACARLDVQPEEVLFIDDDVKNVEAAAALGMHALRFEGVETAQVWMQRLLETETRRRE